jgi:NAD(P)-dependent dehydrogenase (short-subunit alcohol dehydrogenase family)
LNLLGNCPKRRIGTPHRADTSDIHNIASTAARTAAATHAAYCASKTGLIGLTRAVALEGAPHGITCVAVSPGWVETDMLRESASILASKSGRTQAEECDHGCIQSSKSSDTTLGNISIGRILLF